MFKSDIIDVDGLTSYINDTKPYHSKLLDIVIDYQYDDQMAVSIDDSKHSIAVNLNSQWTRNSKNTGWKLFDIADGSMKYKKWRIPACSMPGYSIDYDKRQPITLGNTSIGYQYDRPINLPFDTMDVSISATSQLFNYVPQFVPDGFDVTSYDVTEDLIYTTVSMYDHEDTVLLKVRDPAYLTSDPVINFVYTVTYTFSDDLSKIDNLSAYFDKKYVNHTFYSVNQLFDLHGNVNGSQVILKINSNVVISSTIVNEHNSFDSDSGLDNYQYDDASMVKYVKPYPNFDQLFRDNELIDVAAINSTFINSIKKNPHAFYSGQFDAFNSALPLRSTPSHQIGVRDQIALPTFNLISSKLFFDDSTVITEIPTDYIGIQNGFDLMGINEVVFDDDSTIQYLSPTNPKIRFKYTYMCKFDQDISQLPTLYVYEDATVLTRDVDYEINGNSIIIRKTTDVEFSLIDYPELADGVIDFNTNEIINLSYVQFIVKDKLESIFHFSFADSNSRSYRIPYNSTVQVTVNGIEKYLGVDYTISTPDRSIVTFLKGREPQSDDEITFNLFNFDRLFIKINDVWQDFIISYDSRIIREVDGQMSFDVFIIDNTYFDTSTPLIKKKNKQEVVINETVFSPFGSIKIINDVNEQKYYTFEFTDIPVAGTKIEFQIEQYSMYRGWTQTTITDVLKIRDRVRLRDFLNIGVNELLGLNIANQYSDESTFNIIDQLVNHTDENESLDVSTFAIIDEMTTKYKIKFADSLDTHVGDKLRIFTKQHYEDSFNVSYIDSTNWNDFLDTNPLGYDGGLFDGLSPPAAIGQNASDRSTFGITETLSFRELFKLTEILSIGGSDHVTPFDLSINEDSFDASMNDEISFKVSGIDNGIYGFDAEQYDAFTPMPA